MARKIPTGSGIDRLPATHWKHVRNVHCPARPGDRIDHVLVGPSGVYVIGYVASDGVAITSETTGGHATGAGGVAGLLPERYRSKIRPALCFRGNEPVADLVAEVMVASSSTLAHILRSSPVVLSTSEVAEVWKLLDSRLEPFPLPQVRSRRWVAWLQMFTVLRGRSRAV